MRIFLFTLFALISLSGIAQVKEINPSIQWRFVKSQELDLKDGNWYQYEFVAEKGFDYLFTMTGQSENSKASIQVFDLQHTKIADLKSDSAGGQAALLFDVSFSGTYLVYFGVNEKDTPDQSPVKVLFTLVRREKV